MPIGEITIKLVLLALPGLVGSRVYRKFRGRPVRARWEDFVEVLIFCALSYLSYVGIWWFLYCTSPLHFAPLGRYGYDETLRFVDRPSPAIVGLLSDENKSINWLEVTKVTLLGTLLGAMAARAERRQTFVMAAKRMGLMSGAGDEDVWFDFLNDPSVLRRWFLVIDHEANVFYVTGIDSFSRWPDVDGKHELVLERVVGYIPVAPPWPNMPPDLKPIGEFPKVYISRNASKLTIRLYYTKEEAKARMLEIVRDTVDNEANEAQLNTEDGVFALDQLSSDEIAAARNGA